MLGGISNKNVNKLRLFDQVDFAGISYFEQKKALERGPFIIYLLTRLECKRNSYFVRIFIRC